MGIGPIGDPSHCKLADGRDAFLRQGELIAPALGECAGDTTHIFSLWIGGKKLCSREIWPTFQAPHGGQSLDLADDSNAEDAAALAVRIDAMAAGRHCI